MDTRFLDRYEIELQHVRGMLREYAGKYHKIAGRLGLGRADNDPYVERLIDSFAFLAARVQFKLDAEFPRFTEQLLSVVSPHYLAPTPSMGIVEFRPDFEKGSLNEGVPIRPGTPLFLDKDIIDQYRPADAVQYLTKYPVTLWPFELVEAEYLPYSSAVTNLGIQGGGPLKAGLRIRLRVVAPGISFGDLPLDELPLYLNDAFQPGGSELQARLYEQFAADAFAVVLQPSSRSESWEEQRIAENPVELMGFSDEERLLPYPVQSFQGYRLLHEYFAFPQRYFFIKLKNLRQAMARCDKATELDIVVLFKRSHSKLAEAVQADNLKLFCSPVINLFEKIPDIVDVTPTHHEFLIEPDKFRSTHYEVYDVLDVVGCSADLAKRKLFQPVFGANHGYWSDEGGGYYTFRRELQESLKPQEYLGSLAYISLVDTEHAPYHFHDIKKLDLKILCTNGNLPAKIAPLLGSVPSDFVLKTGAPIKAVRCLAGPSLPRHSFASGESAWRVASHLSLNYLSLLDKVGEAGAVALRELLTLYRSAGDTYALDKISGLSSVYSENVVRRIDTKGPIVFGRGLRIFLEFDKRAYETNGLFLLGAVLAEFFARYASINSFTETVIRSAEREVPWRMRTGQRHIL